MDTPIKDLYETPSTLVTDVINKRVICASGTRSNYGDSNPGVDPEETDEDGIWVW